MTRVFTVLIMVGLLSVIFVATAIASVTGADPASVSIVAGSLGVPQPLTVAETGAAIGLLPSTSTADAAWSFIMLGLVAAAVAFALVRRRISA